jgi:hypothetical protein
MPGFFRRVLLFAAFSGEVVCILGAAAPVYAQNSTAPAQLNRSAAVMSSGVGPSMVGISHVETFAAFQREIGASELTAREEAITGRNQPRVDWTMVNRTTIGLTDEEWKTAYGILLEGSQRVAEWSDEMQDALGWREGRFQADPAQRTARTAKFDALSARGDSIVEETMFRLRRQLGEDAFGKLDAFVSQHEGGRRSVDQGPIRKGPIETAQAAGAPARQ